MPPAKKSAAKQPPPEEPDVLEDDVLAPEDDLLDDGDVTLGDALVDHDKADAILRDPNVPGDVRAFVSQVMATTVYLSTAEFSTDSDGFVTVKKKEAAE